MTDPTPDPTPGHQTGDDVCSHGRPDHQELVREVREAVGLFAGAMPITPRAAWGQAINAIKELRSGRCWKCMEREQHPDDLRAAVAAANQRADDLEAGGNALAQELNKWGWGDLHYGPTGQERSVTDAIARWRALVADQPATSHRPYGPDYDGLNECPNCGGDWDEGHRCPDPVWPDETRREPEQDTR